jgi:membrane fusion protein (multidrug efflux system)
MSALEADRLHLACLALSLLLCGCSTEISGNPPVRTSAPPAARPVAVRVASPEPVDQDSSYASNLYVERDVRVTARRTGVIEQVLADRGSWVRAGQALAVLESDVATAELEIARQDLLLAQSDYDRVDALHSQKIASVSDYDRLKIGLAGAHSRVDLAQAALERCTVRAPFAGQIVERWAVIGLRVEEDDGTPLFRVVAKDPVRARVDVPERDLQSLRIGAPAWLALGGAAPASSARIVFISPAIDAASGTAPVIVESTSRDERLRAGAAVRVRFEARPAGKDPMIRLPRESLVGNPPPEGEAEVLIIAGGRAVRRRIQIVESRGNSVLVRGGLDPSDRVIVGAGAGLSEGDAVVATDRAR